MDKRHLVSDERLDIGSQILTILDDAYFDYYAAGWVYENRTGKWRFLVSTRLLRNKGLDWLYDYLSRMFRLSPLPDGVSPADVFVIHPEYEMILFGDIGGTDIVKFSQDLFFPGVTVSAGFVLFLRRLPFAERSKARNPGRSFARRIKRLEAAAAGGPPAGPDDPETPE